VFTQARTAFRDQACVYVQTRPDTKPIRIGKATQGLEARYRGGTGYTVDAAMQNSGNLVFVAPVDVSICGAVESELIWQGRRTLSFNNQGKLVVPVARFTLIHEGDAPDFNDFDR
jgi:hypothetical protein